MSGPDDQDRALDAARRRAARARQERERARGEWRRGPDLAKRIEGREGWLFISNDTNDVLGQHTGRVRMGGEQLERWSDLLRARMSLTHEVGARWLCVVAPDKEAVYSEFLPADLVPSPRRPVHQFLDLAERIRAPVVYPLAELRAAKGDRLLYTRTGTHWNHVGAFCAYRLTCAELSRRGVEPHVVAPDAVTWRDFEHPREGESIRALVRPQVGRIVFDNRVFNHGRIIVFERDDGVGPSAVAFSESFGRQLLVFLKESFRRLVFVHTSTMPREILEREAPDVVLSFPTERFLIQPPSDAAAMQQVADEVRIKLETGAVSGLAPYLRGIPRASDLRTDVELPWLDLA